MAQAAALTVATLVQHYGPKMQKSCDEWVRQNLSLQPCRNWAISVICGFGSVEANVSGLTPVQDATAPPYIRTTGCYRVAPRTLAYKARRRKRRSHGGGGDDDGPEWDEGRFGGSGGWDGSDNGRGGGDYWGESWNEEGWWWEEAGDAAFNLLYQVACWISLSQCLHFVLKKVTHLGQDGVDESSGDAGAFAQCSSAFALCDFQRMPPAADNYMARWKQTPSGLRV